MLHIALEIPLAALDSLGFSSATTRAPRGLRCSMKRLIAPPFPGGVAALEQDHDSLARFSFTQLCSFSSSVWRTNFCCS